MYFAMRIFAFFLCSSSFVYGTEVCSNPVSKPYHSNPPFYSPENTRGIGIKIWIKGHLSEIPDTRSICLPIALRYNNPGVLKTRSSGFWPNQMGKDSKGHAVFNTVEAGIAAWGMWIKKKHDSGNINTAFSIMNIYAPSTDCVGSIGTPPNCPYGVNPTEEYALKVAQSVNKKPRDPLNLDGADCKEGRKALYALFQQISTFEIGGNFCGRPNKTFLPACHVDRVLFDKAIDEVYGPVKNQC